MKYLRRTGSGRLYPVLLLFIILPIVFFAALEIQNLRQNASNYTSCTTNPLDTLQSYNIYYTGYNSEVGSNSEAVWACEKLKEIQDTAPEFISLLQSVKTPLEFTDSPGNNNKINVDVESSQSKNIYDGHGRIILRLYNNQQAFNVLFLHELGYIFAGFVDPNKSGYNQLSSLISSDGYITSYAQNAPSIKTEENYADAVTYYFNPESNIYGSYANNPVLQDPNPFETGNHRAYCQVMLKVFGPYKNSCSPSITSTPPTTTTTTTSTPTVNSCEITGKGTCYQRNCPANTSEITDITKNSCSTHGQGQWVCCATQQVIPSPTPTSTPVESPCVKQGGTAAYCADGTSTDSCRPGFTIMSNFDCGNQSLFCCVRIAPSPTPIPTSYVAPYTNPTQTPVPTIPVYSQTLLGYFSSELQQSCTNIQGWVCNYNPNGINIGTIYYEPGQYRPQIDFYMGGPYNHNGIYIGSATADQNLNQDYYNQSDTGLYSISACGHSTDHYFHFSAQNTGIGNTSATIYAYAHPWNGNGIPVPIPAPSNGSSVTVTCNYSSSSGGGGKKQ